jgi:hypothetical protein
MNEKIEVIKLDKLPLWLTLIGWARLGMELVWSLIGIVLFILLGCGLVDYLFS